MTHSDVPSPESLLEHREWLRALARSLVADENTVDEVEQRAWMRVLRNRRPIDSVRGWLRRVVRSEVVDAHRAGTRRRRHEEMAARPEGHATERLVELADAQRCIAAAVKGLPEPYRSTVLLRYFEELSVGEVAARMECPPETVRTRLKRALALLREALDSEFGGREAWPAAFVALAKTRPAVPAAVGGAAMATKAWIAAAALLGVAAGLWVVTRSGDTIEARNDDGPSSETVAQTGRPGRVARQGRTVAADATTAPEPAAPAGARVAVRVRADDGLPLEGTTVLAWLGEDSGRDHGARERAGSEDGIDAADVGAEGVARLPAAAVARKAIVAAPGRPLVATTIPAGNGLCEVVLSGAVSVRGVVRVDGAPPTEPIRLLLMRDDERPLAAPEIPAAVVARLDELGRSNWRWMIPARVDASGAFAFTGVEDGVGVSIAFPDQGLVLRGPRPQTYSVQSVAARTPTSDVFLDLLRLPRVTGRVVEPAGGPIAGARVLLDAVTEDMGQGDVAAASGPDGRFVISAPSFALKSVTLMVSRADGSGMRSIPVPVEGLTSREIGDVAIAAVRDVTLQVRDSGGGPVAGAVAIDANGATGSEQATGEDGRAVVRVTAGRSRLRVGAVEYLPREVEAGDAASIDVVLERATVLEVGVTGAQRDGTFSLRVDSDGALFDTASGTFDHVAPWGASSAATEEESSEGHAWIRFAQRDAGSFLVAGLRPAVPLRLRLFDRFDTLLGDRQVVLAAKDRQRIEFEVPAPRRLRVRVVGEDGRPPADATVEVLTDPPPDPLRPHGSEVPVDAAGWASVLDLRSGRVRLTVRCAEHPCWQRRGVEVPASGSELEVRLEKARELQVVVRDARGVVVKPSGVYAVRPAAKEAGVFLSSIAGADDSGRCTIGDCPEGPVVVHVVLEDGSDLQFPVDSAAEATLTLPKK